jgi:hypothetical protein
MDRGDEVAWRGDADLSVPVNLYRDDELLDMRF